MGQGFELTSEYKMESFISAITIDYTKIAFNN